MGNAFSEEGIENKNIVEWLIDCGFVVRADVNTPVGTFVFQLHQGQESLVPCLLESFNKKKNAS